MSQIRSDHDRTAIVEFAKLDFHIASRRFQEDKLRTAARGMAANFFQTKYIPIERNRLFQVRHAIACMQKLFDHRYLIAPNDAIISNSGRIEKIFSLCFAWESIGCTETGTPDERLRHWQYRIRRSHRPQRNATTGRSRACRIRSSDRHESAENRSEADGDGPSPTAYEQRGKATQSSIEADAGAQRRDSTFTAMRPTANPI